LVLEPIGADKVRATSTSCDHEQVILPDQALEIAALGKQLYFVRALRRAEYLNVDESGMSDGPKP
jgi:hypothetical protein